MHHFIGKKQILWIWKVFYHTSRRFLVWECGDLSTAILEKLNNRKNLHQAKRVYTDKYIAYAKVIVARH